ncbi:MSHA biogenesis protein MshA [Janthinobacterium sp. DSP2-3-3]|uniref:MSHA biogenesis protein MshA n=1 Tax=Janthinobacterium sp. DSP2-3-3 TaxID=2804596 RepID=UPI003CE7D333
MSQQINLFNPAFEKQKQVLTAAGMAQALGLILLLSGALVWYGAHQVYVLERAAADSKVMLAAREARRADVLTRFPTPQKDPLIARALGQAEADRAALFEAQTILQGGELGNTQGYADYFRAFAHARVNGLWLTGASIVGAGKEIGLQGRTVQPDLVPQYIRALSRESVLQGKSFARLDMAAAQIPAPMLAAPVAPSGATAAAVAAPSLRFIEFSLQSSAAPVVGAAGAVKE